MAETWSTPFLRKDVTVGLNLRSALGAGDGGHVWTRSHFQDVEGSNCSREHLTEAQFLRTPGAVISTEFPP